MSHLKIETCSSQEPSLGLADSRGFPAVPRCPIYSFSKNRGSPRGPSSNAPLSCAGRVAWGNGVTSVSFWFFGPQKHGYHNMNPTRIFFCLTSVTSEEIEAWKLWLRPGKSGSLHRKIQTSPEGLSSSPTQKPQLRLPLPCSVLSQSLLRSHSCHMRPQRPWALSRVDPASIPFTTVLRAADTCRALEMLFFPPAP